MEQGLPIPRALERNFPPDLIATPIEDIDPYYEDQAVSINDNIQFNSLTIH